MEEDKIDERTARIEELQAEVARRKTNADAFRHQHMELLVALKEMDSIKTKEIEKTLDNLPNASPKGLVDKILQLSDPKRGQLLGNIDKMKIAMENEVRKMRIANEGLKRLENEIYQGEIDDHVKEVYRVFLGWIDDYKNCRTKFYNELLPIIQDGYGKDRFFYKRTEKLGLNKSVMVSIESHFREGEVISMEEAIAKILNLSDAYGEPLLTKDGFSGSWPDNPESYFGINTL